MNKGMDIEMGRLPWIFQVDRLINLHKPLKAEGRSNRRDEK